ncbi:hypothetical protein CL630_01600 [bacterium]|nr:hypothetical protein [bacterium]|tara:strand:- start:13150 stop:13860 length:711 start_codon:yes stop_codon:yes gene_type:complete
MNNIHPTHTQNFIKDVKEKAKKGAYRVNVDFRGDKIPVDVYPGVFPPSSDYSFSSKSIYENLGTLEGKVVLDLGTGTGIEAIVAVKLGASYVDAVDINPVAIECASHNIELNNLGSKIQVFESDLFSNIENGKRYDLIIANLPIENSAFGEEDYTEMAFYDPDFEIHKRSFKDVRKYLKENGVLVFTHANLRSKDTENPMSDFLELELLLKAANLDVLDKVVYDKLGFTWINYKVK